MNQGVPQYRKCPMETAAILAIRSLVANNNLRSQAYHADAERATHPDLKALFAYLSYQSQTFTKELETYLPENAGVKTDFGSSYVSTATTRTDILMACVSREESSRRQYDNFLARPGLLAGEIADLISRHMAELTRSYNTVVSLVLDPGNGK